MSEKYIIRNTNNVSQNTLILGKYYDKVHDKHLKAYGEHGASNILDNIKETYIEIQSKLLDPCANKNTLLVGKVQSGKTSNLEMFTALAFDNGYNLLVIYGGYDTTLLNQTTNRFISTFDIPSEIRYDDDCPAIFTTDDSNQILNIDDEIIEELLASGKPIIFVSMKRPVAMNKINGLFERLSNRDFKAFIIDDEGDQASLNTARDKRTGASPTYQAIVNMKHLLSDPMYLSVTATPQANIFLDEFSALRPDSIRLIQPANGYCGAEEYHLYDNTSIEIITLDDHANLDENRLPQSIRDAVNYFIVASAIMKKRGIDYSDMIIHSYRTVDQHGVIYNCVESYKEEFKTLIADNAASLKHRFAELEDCYNHYISEKNKQQYQFGSLIENIKIVVKGIYVILKNSRGKITQTNEGLRKHKIYIGGDLLQRGLTFKNLVATYFTRWALDNGNMDTNLQRARWFGYRDKYVDLFKLFTTENIAQEFSNLAEIEEDLWEQFYSIEKGELAIDDILIRSEGTKQKPTRRNVANYRRVAFRNRWIKQRYGIFDRLQVKANNNVVDALISSLKLRDTTAGRRDNGVSAQYAVIKSSQVNNLISHIQTIFEYDPFERQALQDLLGEDDVPIILMSRFFDSGRIRSFYVNESKIKALHQGADNKDKTKIVYEGDSFVVVNKDKVNIQIHKIIPVRKSENGIDELQELTQYMFAIYVPREKIYFVKGQV